MKKIIIFLFLLFLNHSIAQAEEILDFDQIINVEKDGTLMVKEVISYDFGNEQKHGIFRDIPYKYERNGGNYNLRIDDVKVTDGGEKKYDFEIQKSGPDKRLKIGSEDEFVTGKRTYIIEYRVKKAINFFDDQDEIYWNVTGNKWPVEIRQTKSTIILPDKISENELRMDCFSGPFGSNEQCVSKRFVYEGAGMVKQAVFIDDVLQPGYGFTVVLGMPKGFIAEPSLIAKIVENLIDNLILGLPVLVFLAMFYLWYKYGRDKGGKETIVAQFEAPIGLSPMGVGTLVDERADNKDFSANIINLAVKGHLKIVRIEEGKWFKKTDYALIRKKQLMPNFAEHFKETVEKSEWEIYKEIFDETNLENDKKKIEEVKTIANEIEDIEVVMLSDLKDKFYVHLARLKTHIYEELTYAGYFKGNPQTIRKVYLVIGGILLAGSFFLIDIIGLQGTLSLLLSGLIIVSFGFFMPAKTPKGTLAKEHILGLKEYLRVAEADRLKFHNAPEKNPATFEMLLPFAMVLGVEKEWAKQFEDIYRDQQPSWYAGNSTHAFSAIALTDSMKSFSANASTAASTSPSSAGSGGSGFSGGGVGGGFGGGGGGSW